MFQARKQIRGKARGHLGNLPPPTIHISALSQGQIASRCKHWYRKIVCWALEFTSQHLPRGATLQRKNTSSGIRQAWVSAPFLPHNICGTLHIYIPSLYWVEVSLVTFKSICSLDFYSISCPPDTYQRLLCGPPLKYESVLKKVVSPSLHTHPSTCLHACP